MKADVLIMNAFSDMMKKYPYSDLPKGTAYKLNEGIYLLKGYYGFYDMPFRFSIIKNLDSAFCRCLDYHIYLLTNCVIQTSFEVLLTQMRKSI